MFGWVAIIIIIFTIGILIFSVGLELDIKDNALRDKREALGTAQENEAQRQYLWDKIVKLNRVEIWIGRISLCCYFLAIILCIPTVCLLTKARKEVETNSQTYLMIEQVLNNGDEFEKMGLAKAISDYNEWLAQARADKNVFGCFSRYHYEDLEKLQYVGQNARQGMTE